MTPLREAFVRELTLRGTSPRTQESYVAAVYQLAKFHRAAPDQLSDDQLKDFLLYLIEQRQLSASSVNQAVSALRAFYGWVLHREVDRMRLALPRIRREIHRPQVYSTQEVERLLTVGCCERGQRAFLMTVYGAGLRLNEAQSPLQLLELNCLPTAA